MPVKEEVTGRQKTLHTLKLHGIHSPLNTSSEQIREYKMNGAGDNGNAYNLRFCWESLQDRGQLRNLDVNRCIKEYHIKIDYKQIKLGYVTGIFMSFE